MKITYVIDSLASKGGAERILSEKMNYLAAHYNYDVYVITCYQYPQITPNAYYLSEQVKQIDLEIPYYSQYNYKYPKRLWVKFSLYKKLIKGLNETIRQIDPDILIGLGYFRADTICKIKCRAAKIIESHQARAFTLTSQGLYRSMITKTYMNFFREIYFRTIEKKADVVVTLTNGDAYEWRRSKRIVIIPNFTMMQSKTNDYHSERKRIISVGRLEWQKGYNRLIDIWKIISSKYPDWELAIFGSGTLESEIKSSIKSAGLKNITINPFTPEIHKEYSNSSIFAMSSYFEGFPLVLIEALQHGLPCIAFDCQFGPKDVIEDGQCGFIVKENDITQYAERLSKLIESQELRESLSTAARKRAEEYDIASIMRTWKELFDSLKS